MTGLYLNQFWAVASPLPITWYAKSIICQESVIFFFSMNTQISDHRWQWGLRPLRKSSEDTHFTSEMWRTNVFSALSHVFDVTWHYLPWNAFSSFQVLFSSSWGLCFLSSSPSLCLAASHFFVDVNLSYLWCLILLQITAGLVDFFLYPLWLLQQITLLVNRIQLLQVVAILSFGLSTK